MRLEIDRSLAIAAAATSVLSACNTLPAHAAARCSIEQVITAENAVNSAKRVLLSNDKSISGDAMQEAKSLLDGLGAKELSQSLEACVEPKSLKDRAMDQAAFIVYYEEVRYGDTRLEPQVPSKRAEQNGRMKEFLRALEDERAELAYLLDGHLDEDTSELRKYAATTSASIEEFRKLVSSSSIK